MVIHDTEYPYRDQVSLNNTNQTKPTMSQEKIYTSACIFQHEMLGCVAIWGNVPKDNAITCYWTPALVWFSCDVSIIFPHVLKGGSWLSTPKYTSRTHPANTDILRDSLKTSSLCASNKSHSVFVFINSHQRFLTFTCKHIYSSEHSLVSIQRGKLQMPNATWWLKLVYCGFHYHYALQLGYSIGHSFTHSTQFVTQSSQH